MSKNVHNKMWEKLNQTLLIEKRTLGMNKYLTPTKNAAKHKRRCSKMLILTTSEQKGSLTEKMRDPGAPQTQAQESKRLGDRKTEGNVGGSRLNWKTLELGHLW